MTPRTRAKQETSAGGVVIRREQGRPFVLLIRDSYGNWGFPKGHLEGNELPERAALREVAEETGVQGLTLRGMIDTIDWYFRFRGRLVHKVCHFYLMECESAATQPQREEGITACRWVPVDEAPGLISYANARGVLDRAAAMVDGRSEAATGGIVDGPADAATDGPAADRPADEPPSGNTGGR